MLNLHIKGNILALFSISVSGLLLSGCVGISTPQPFMADEATGTVQLQHYTQSSLEAALIKGKTTKKEVINLFGKPAQDVQVENGSVLGYSSMKVEYGFTNNVTSKNLTIQFDGNDLVKDFRFY